MKQFISLIALYFSWTTLGFPKISDSVDYPQIGKPCPDFTLTDVEYLPKSTVSLSDFKGKWLILDFWGEYCVSCVESFPKLNEIQREFKDDIQILMVGIPYKDPETIKRLFESHRTQKNLEIPIAYNKKLSEQFGVGTYPHIVMVDPTGVVRHITYQFNREQIADMLNNEPITLPRSYGLFDRKPYADYDTEIPLLINGNGGEQSDYLFRSVLTEATELTPPLFNIESESRFEALGFTLEMLYKYAYGGFFSTFLSSDSTKYGKLWPLLIFETTDTALFFGDFETRENLYSYSVHVSDQYFKMFGNTKLDFRNVLRNDLLTCFPYSIIIEKRLMPCYELRISNSDLRKIQTKTNTSSLERIGGKGVGFKATNLSFSALLSQISNSLGYPQHIPLVYYGDEVYIDIMLESIYYEDRLNELINFGFTVIESQKEMDVIVVRDRATTD